MDERNLKQISKYLESHKDYLVNYDFNRIYQDTYNENWLSMCVRDMTNIFYIAGLDPLKYLDHVPNSYLYLDDKRESIDIPNEGIEYIDQSAFFNCGNLKYIKIPDSVTRIYGSAFEGCCKANIDFGNNLEIIDERAFAHCYNLQKLDFPESLKTIAAEAFSYCNSVTSIIIPKGLLYIDSEAFNLCTELQTIEWNAQFVQLGKNIFKGCAQIHKKPININYKYSKRDFTNIVKNSLDNFSFNTPVIVKCTDGELQYGDR